MRSCSRFFTLLLFVATATGAAADVLETRDGRLLSGTYLGGTQQSVRFQVDGTVEVLTLDQVLAVTFERTLAAPATAPKAAAPAPQNAGQTAPTASAAVPKTSPAPAAPRVARVPAGTRLRVRMIDSLDARLAAVGDAFTATLETGLGIDGVPIVPAGSKAYGQVAELRESGPAAQRLKLELTGLMIQGQLLELVTGSQTLAPAPAAPGSPEKAPETPAAAPARANVPAGTELEFRLLQPFELRLQ